MLTFNEPMQEQFAVLTVVGPDGNFWQDGKATVDGPRLSVVLRPLGPVGTYTVNYRITSADGHPVEGQRRFTLTVAGTGHRARRRVTSRTRATGFRVAVRRRCGRRDRYRRGSDGRDVTPPQELTLSMNPADGRSRVLLVAACVPMMVVGLVAAAVLGAVEIPRTPAGATALRLSRRWPRRLCWWVWAECPRSALNLRRRRSV